MEDENEDITSRVLGPGVYIPFLTRVPLIVGAVLVLTLSDFAVPGAMHEALRYSILDRPYQLVIIAAALFVACLTLRYTAEAIIELVAPDLFEDEERVHLLAQLLPRVLALVLGIALSVPLLELTFDTRAFPLAHARMTACAFGTGCAAIGLFVALLPRIPHKPKFSLKDTETLTRCGYALPPLLLAIAFAGAVLGLFQPASGTAYHALERYVTAIVGMADDGSSPNGPLQSYVQDAAGDTVARYEPYIRPAPYAVSTVSPGLVAAELVSLFVACIAVRLAIAISFDLFVPGFGAGGFLARMVRNWLPRLGSAGLGSALAGQMLYYYLSPQPGLTLSPIETRWVLGIAASYAAIGLLASLGRGSSYVGQGPWRDSASVGRRFLGAAHRLSSLEFGSKWCLAIWGLAALAVLALFADPRYVVIAQSIGPVGVILLWGFVSATLFFPLAYLSHMTRIHTLTILFIAGATFAGFDLNDNHELRVVPASANVSDQRPTLDLEKWIASRSDWNQYDRYPVFLIATEGGGIRAAYFTASLLAALQERCPAFAQHTLAISGVSGGSVGAATFAALAADEANNLARPGCNLAGTPKPGPMVQRARAVLSTDLLSPLLGAMLFPDALQRILPVAIPETDRSRAIEYAIEDSWRKATKGDCGRCDGERMSERAAELYSQPAPGNAAPNLFLNTTEAGTGQIIPYATVRVMGLATPFRKNAEIDDGSFDGVVPSPGEIEHLSLQDRMANDLIPLSTAAVVSARFPYLTPAGHLSYSGGDYVDGGYFENSGTWLIAGLVQNLIGQQLSYPAGKSPQFDAARNAVFIVIVVQSEPCTRASTEASCDEDATTADDSWNEIMSPPRALLSTRDMRAEYSFDSLNAISALIEQLSRGDRGKGSTPDDAVGCDYPVCGVTLRFRNRTRTDIPLSWVLSSEGRRSMDNAVDGMERADVRSGTPPASVTSLDDTQDIDRVLGSYRRVLCLLAAQKSATPCVSPAASAAPAGTADNLRRQKLVSR